MQFQGKGILGRENSQYKGFEVGLSGGFWYVLVCVLRGVDR